MQLYSDKLAAHLKQTLAPVYLVAGDEILLKNEACDAIRDAAKKQGFIERETFTYDHQSDWMAWLDSCNAMSLFASQRLIELRLPSSKIGAVGSDAVHRFCENPPPDTVLLIVASRIEGSPKWVKSATQAGAYIPIWPLDYEQLPNWLTRRAKALHLKLGKDAATLLAERVEGNLMAAAQELEKLALLLPKDSAVSRETIGKAVADSARFSAYNALDHAIDGDAAGACRGLRHLREEGNEPAAVVGAFAAQLRNLAQLKAFESRGQLSSGFKAVRVNRKRQGAIQACVGRLSSQQLEEFVRLAAEADVCSKSVEKESAWLLLEGVLLGIAGVVLPTQRFHLEGKGLG